MGTDGYSSPLSERYASREMQYIFSQDMKFKTWRRLWIALAETEMELGLSQNGRQVITKEQIDELKAHADYVTAPIGEDGVLKACRHFQWFSGFKDDCGIQTCPPLDGQPAACRSVRTGSPSGAQAIQR